MATTYKFRALFARLTVITAAMSALPLIYLGLITPHVKTAALIGATDIGLAIIIALQAYAGGADRVSE